MIYAFIEDGTLELIADAGEARSKYEGIDVEAGVVTFFDEKGAPLEAVFSVPNRRGKTLGLIPWVESGVFDLAPAVRHDGDSFALALSEAVALAPNPWFRTLDELRAHARQLGIGGDRA